MDPLNPQWLAKKLASWQSARHYWIALSGGLDSMVLLDLAARCPNFHFRAVHIHHGLQPGADAWWRHCRYQCWLRKMPIWLIPVTIPSNHDQGIEGAARKYRYEALAARMEPGDCMLTAHHADDQAETFLLHALRGSGSRGLSAMKPWKPWERGALARPLLPLPRSALYQYAHTQNVRYIDDPSNDDPRFARSYLRREVMPVLAARWPATNRALSRAAALCGETQHMAEAYAEHQLRSVEQGSSRLSLPALLALDPSQRYFILLHWLRLQGCSTPPLTRVREFFRQIEQARTDRQLQLKWPDAQLRTYRQTLYLLHGRNLRVLSTPAPFPCPWDPHAPLPLGDLGSLHLLRPSVSPGLRPELQGAKLSLDWRRGGEVMTPAGDRHERTLKSILQQAGIVPWMREKIPLLYIDGQLGAVANLCMDTRFTQQDTHATGWSLHWKHDLLLH